MPPSFLHGVETFEVQKGPRPIRQVRTAVVFLVGTAPMGPLNVPTLVLGERDAAQFGPESPDFTIPQAINDIFNEGYGTIVVMNVCDPDTHKTAVTNELKTFNNQNKLVLDHPHISSLVVKNQAGSTTYVLNTDYTRDLVTGEIERVVGGAITANQQISASYSYVDPTEVENADVIGTTTVGGQRTGLQGSKDVYSLFGFKPKLFLAPVFSTQNSVSAEMNSLAHSLKAMSLVDAPVGTTFSQAITGRGPSGTINFNISSERAILCFPHIKTFNKTSNAEELRPLSSSAAGVICRTDNEFGYWYSPSNKEIRSALGAEIPLTSDITDAQSETNVLNENGIVTVFNSFGSGIRLWGNRSSAWPANTNPETFISIRRTKDVLHESIEFSMLQFLDRPINDALIDAIVASCNAFMRTLIGRGALIDGFVSYDPNKNPPTEIALGHLLFDVTFMPPTPAERITFESFLDINLLASLGTAA